MLYSLGMFVTLMDDCNLDCKFCKFPKRNEFRNGKMLDSGKFAEMLHQLKEQPPQIPLGAVCFCGSGEPLLYPHLIEIVEETKKYVPYVSIVTNGILLTEQICTGLLQADVNHVVISVTGMEEDVYKKFQGSGSKTADVGRQLQLVKENVIRMTELRDCLHANTQIGISYILNHESKADYFKALQYWNEIGVNYVDTRILSKGFKQNTEDFSTYIKNNQRWWGDGNLCTCFGKVMNVFTDGRIGYCNCAYKEETILGSLYDSSLKEIIDSDKFQNLLRIFTEDYESVPELCKTCDLLKARPILA